MEQTLTPTRLPCSPSMFTGLVEDCGTVSHIKPQSAGILLVIDVQGSLLETTPDASSLPNQIGDSIAINGCCLTVVEIEDNRWSFQAGTETLSKTNLGNLQVGDRVNLLQHGRITYGRVVGETSVGELTELVASDYRRRA